MDFGSLANLVNGITQGYFGEPVVYKRGDTETPLKGVFEMQWVEVNGVSAHSMTCQIQANVLGSAPMKNDQVVRGAKTYTVAVSQQSGDGSLITLILKD